MLYTKTNNMIYCFIREIFHKEEYKTFLTSTRILLRLKPFET
jgi:hypothetical protein